MTTNDFPFIEVRGQAESPVSEPVGAQTESAANRRAPFPAFASAGGGGDDRGGDRGSRRAGRRPARRARVGRRSPDVRRGIDRRARRAIGAPAPADGGGTPPIRPGDEALDALGLAFGGDDDDDDDDDDER